MNTRQNTGSMSHQEQALLEKIRTLPPERVIPERVIEVEDFIDFLRLRNEDRRLTMDASKLSEKVFHDTWDNPEDAVYDRL
jgi:hypothetical protein